MSFIDAAIALNWTVGLKTFLWAGISKATFLNYNHEDEADFVINLLNNIANIKDAA